MCAPPSLSSSDSPPMRTKSRHCRPCSSFSFFTRRLPSRGLAWVRRMAGCERSIAAHAEEREIDQEKELRSTAQPTGAVQSSSRGSGNEAVCHLPQSSYDWRRCGGGESGIRTHGTVARTPVFETGAFVHSAISPRVEPGRVSCPEIFHKEAGLKPFSDWKPSIQCIEIRIWRQGRSRFRQGSRDFRLLSESGFTGLGDEQDFLSSFVRKAVQGWNFTFSLSRRRRQHCWGLFSLQRRCVCQPACAEWCLKFKAR